LSRWLRNRSLYRPKISLKYLNRRATIILNNHGLHKILTPHGFSLSLKTHALLMHLIQCRDSIWIYWRPYLLPVATKHVLINHWWSRLRLSQVTHCCLHDGNDSALSSGKSHAELLETRQIKFLVQNRANGLLNHTLSLYVRVRDALFFILRSFDLLFFLQSFDKPTILILMLRSFGLNLITLVRFLVFAEFLFFDWLLLFLLLGWLFLFYDVIDCPFRFDDLLVLLLIFTTKPLGGSAGDSLVVFLRGLILLKDFLLR
jgi:hypothetical protein